ncbi:hypothetical protein HLH44_03530 [Gluconacetobacter sp. 1c LMG 22058]|uniref:Uncharacterized protein n=1 Tax=Gluconacetobacter dulcium TaxID=2729096 RepID=A0A7W4JXG3_9PROT|nr:hypothetical protein [Gluconacetobacter dulcium]MBB2196542.1 hypothetical protein [Gluconacetobacter dulcium]
MSDPVTPQPWWVAVLGAGLMTVRWLIGFGGRAAEAEIKRLSDRVDKLEQQQAADAQIITALRGQIAALDTQNALLRQQIALSGAQAAA